MTPDDACWAAFLAAGHTQPSVDADFSGWHRGRPHFAVWAIALAAPAIDARLASVRRRFDGLLRPDYARQAHVTLHVCGFPCERARWPDDFARDRLLRQVRQLAESAVAPFEIALGDIDSFTSAPFFRVEDRSGAIARLRHGLAREGGDGRTTPFLPHVTLGLYNAAHPVADVERQIGDRRLPPLEAQVRQIELMAYESAVLGGPLTTLCRFDLTTRRIV